MLYLQQLFENKIKLVAAHRRFVKVGDVFKIDKITVKTEGSKTLPSDGSDVGGT